MLSIRSIMPINVLLVMISGNVRPGIRLELLPRGTGSLGLGLGPSPCAQPAAPPCLGAGRARRIRRSRPLLPPSHPHLHPARIALSRPAAAVASSLSERRRAPTVP